VIGLINVIQLPCSPLSASLGNKGIWLRGEHHLQLVAWLDTFVWSGQINASFVIAKWVSSQKQTPV